MARYIVEIVVENNYPSIETSSDMPFMLSDKIKDVVREFYKRNNTNK